MIEAPYEPASPALFARLARENPARLADYVHSKVLSDGMHARAVSAYAEASDPVLARRVLLALLEIGTPIVKEAAAGALRPHLDEEARRRLAAFADDERQPEGARAAARLALEEDAP